MLYKKVSERTCLSSPGVELWGLKDYHIWNIIMYWNVKVGSLEGSMLAKLPIISKNCSNKSYSELNFVLKSEGAHVYLPQKRSYGFQKLMFQILYYTEKGKVDSLSGKLLPKTRIISKNPSIKSLRALNFLQKNHWAHMCITFPPPEELRASKDA